MKTVKPDHSKVRYVQLCAETIASRTKNEEFWKTEKRKNIVAILSHNQFTFVINTCARFLGLVHHIC